jgi:hypothetical protein
LIKSELSLISLNLVEYEFCKGLTIEKIAECLYTF